MSNISAKINLRRLKSGVMKVKGQSGNLVECVVIPIAENRLFKTDKGVYLDLIAFELKEKQENRKETHMVKQSLAKEDFDKLSDDEKKALPILGNMVVWGNYEQEPNNFGFDTHTGPVEQGTDDDLPF